MYQALIREADADDAKADEARQAHEFIVAMWASHLEVIYATPATD